MDHWGETLAVITLNTDSIQKAILLNKVSSFPSCNILHAVHRICLSYHFAHSVYFCTPQVHLGVIVGTVAVRLSWWRLAVTTPTSRWEYPQDSVGIQYIWSWDREGTPLGAFRETKPQSGRYVFAADVESLVAIPLDSLMVLNCPMWFPSKLLSSAWCSGKEFSEMWFELKMLPDTEWMSTGLSGMLL